MILAESRISNLRIRNDQKQGLREGQTFKSKIFTRFCLIPDRLKLEG